METKRISEVLNQRTKTKTSFVESNSITKEQFKAKLFEVWPELQIDEHNKKLMNDLYFYVNEKVGALDHTKGILIWGNIGVGKSSIIRVIGELLRLKKQGFKTVNCSFISTEFAAKGLEALNPSTYNNLGGKAEPVNRAFDEIGREPIPARHYGNELNVMQYIFQCRYEIRDQVKTFGTTNLKPDGIRALYGEYIHDRMFEMFNIVELKGESWRKKSAKQ